MDKGQAAVQTEMGQALLKERIEGVGRTAVVSGQVADIGTDRRRAPVVAEGAVTVLWVERRVWGH